MDFCCNVMYSAFISRMELAAFRGPIIFPLYPVFPETNSCYLRLGHLVTKYRFRRWHASIQSLEDFVARPFLDLLYCNSPYRGWQRSDGLLLLHSFLSLDIFAFLRMCPKQFHLRSLARDRTLSSLLRSALSGESKGFPNAFPASLASLLGYLPSQQPRKS